jgi:uncharacterized protein (DUF1015 family)
VSVVRPLAARVVRQAYAAEKVSRMLDTLPAAERPGAVEARMGVLRTVSDEAYAPAGTAFYVYRLRRGDAEHVGLVGEVGHEAFLDGRVRGHEAVQPRRVEGLVEHFSSTAVRSELVALLHRPGPRFVTVLGEVAGGDPVVTFTGPDDWEQTVWRVPDDDAAALSDELGRAVHYVADGHHRVAASLTVWETSGRPPDAGVMCVMYPLDGLSLRAFHRRVSGPVRTEQLQGLHAGGVEVREVDSLHDVGGFCGAYVERRWHDLHRTGPRPPGVAGLDVAILDEHVLAPLLGPAPHASPRLEIASALDDVEALTEACDEDAGALFVLGPPSLDQLTEVADRGEVMPPKTTYFDPKPSAGIFLR